MRKYLYVSGAVVLAVVTVLLWGMFTSAPQEIAPPDDPVASQDEQPRQENTDTIRIVAVGDMLPHDTVNLNAQNGNLYDYTPYFSEVSSQLMNGDIRYCNQESPSGGEQFGISGYPSFNAPLEFPRDLQKVGCNVINLANNHVADRGQEGIDATIDSWEILQPLAHSGANKSPEQQSLPQYFEVNGKKIAFIAFTDLSNNNLSAHSINMFSNELVTQLASTAAQNADYVIASAHWGTEDSPEPNAAQRQWAQLLADNGVDLVIGAGPHVLQPVEVVTAADGREVPVWYSLGNFLSSQLTIEQLVGGIAAIDLDTSGDDIKVSRLSFMPTYMHYEWTAQQAAAEDLLTRNNLKLYPLHTAADPLSRSLFGTTVDEQLQRVTTLLNTETTVEVLTPDQF